MGVDEPPDPIHFQCCPVSRTPVMVAGSFPQWSWSCRPWLRIVRGAGRWDPVVRHPTTVSLRLAPVGFLPGPGSRLRRAPRGLRPQVQVMQRTRTLFPPTSISPRSTSRTLTRPLGQGWSGHHGSGQFPPPRTEGNQSVHRSDRPRRPRDGVLLHPERERRQCRRGT